MASVQLQGVYLARVADLSTTLRLNAGVEIASAETVRGGFRNYAGGRVRLITMPGRDRRVTVSARRIDRATREQLTAWAGQLLLLRDGRGRKMYGAFLEPSFTEQQGLPFCSAALTFVEVTRSEAV